MFKLNVINVRKMREIWSKLTKRRNDIELHNSSIYVDQDFMLLTLIRLSTS